MNAMETTRLPSIASVIPGLKEKSGPVGATLGIQRMVNVPLGPPTLVDGVTYSGILFIAACSGCVINQIWVSAYVAPVGGTNTLALSAHDASADSDANVLEATNWDPTGLTSLEGSEMTLQTTTKANLNLDTGDTLNYVLVCGTQTTNGEGLAAMIVVTVPELE